MLLKIGVGLLIAFVLWFAYEIKRAPYEEDFYKRKNDDKKF